MLPDHIVHASSLNVSKNGLHSTEATFSEDGVLYGRLMSANPRGHNLAPDQHTAMAPGVTAPGK